jgi:hypothetical protein
MKPFCEPAMAQSTPHSSILNGSEPIDEMPSTNSSAGWPAASIALRTAPMSLVTPVAVSLWTTITALMAWSLSARSASSIFCGSAPAPHSSSWTITSRPRRWAMSTQRWLNWP